MSHIFPKAAKYKSHTFPEVILFLVCKINIITSHAVILRQKITSNLLSHPYVE